MLEKSIGVFGGPPHETLFRWDLHLFGALLAHSPPRISASAKVKSAQHRWRFYHPVLVKESLLTGFEDRAKGLNVVTDLYLSMFALNIVFDHPAFEGTRPV